MNKKPELLLAIVIVILIIVGIVAYVLAAPHANAPTTATSTAPTSTTTSTQPVTTTSGATTTYTDPGKTFTFNYPTQFDLSGGDGTYSQDWMVNSTADGMLLVKVDIPQSFEPNTNFVEAYFTVGVSSHPDAVASCLSAPNSDGPAQKSTATINGTTYTKYVSTGVGAGQNYQTTSYRTIHDGQCYAIEYTIHSGNIQNYPSGTVAAFNQSTIQDTLDSIVSSFKFLS